MLATGTSELEEILEECKELILAFAVGQEQRQKDREIASPYEDLLRDFLCKIFGAEGVLGQILK